MRVRKHMGGNYKASMKTVVEIEPTREALKEWIRSEFGNIPDYALNNLEVTKCHGEIDECNGWNDYIVHLSRYGVFGFIDGPLKEFNMNTNQHIVQPEFELKYVWPTPDVLEVHLKTSGHLGDFDGVYFRVDFTKPVELRDDEVYTLFEFGLPEPIRSYGGGADLTGPTNRGMIIGASTTTVNPGMKGFPSNVLKAVRNLVSLPEIVSDYEYLQLLFTNGESIRLPYPLSLDQHTSTDQSVVVYPLLKQLGMLHEAIGYANEWVLSLAMECHEDSHVVRKLFVKETETSGFVIKITHELAGRYHKYSYILSKLLNQPKIVGLRFINGKCTLRTESTIKINGITLKRDDDGCYVFTPTPIDPEEFTVRF